MPPMQDFGAGILRDRDDVKGSYSGNKLMTRVFRQKGGGTCTIYAVTSTMAAILAIQRNKLNQIMDGELALDLSKQELIDGARRFGSFGYDSVYGYAKKYGVFREDCYPPDGEPLELPKWRVTGKRRRASDFDGAIEILRTHGVVSATIPIFESFNLHRTGELYCPRVIERRLKNSHAVTIMAFGIQEKAPGFKNPVPFFLIKNSHGIRCLVNGYGRIHAALAYDFSSPDSVSVEWKGAVANSPNSSRNLADGLDLCALAMFERLGCIFVGGLPLVFEEEHVKRLLQEPINSELRSIALAKDADGHSKGYAFCVYNDVAVTDTAIKIFYGMVIDGVPLLVMRAS